jgi:hypothetical protein
MAGDAAVISEARQTHRVDPQLITRQGVKIVVYSRARVYLDRDAWEMLPADGVLLMQVRPADDVDYSLAFTASELGGGVRRSPEHAQPGSRALLPLPKPPPAISAFAFRRRPTKTPNCWSSSKGAAVGSPLTSALDA